jgi:hypothetical protein
VRLKRTQITITEFRSPCDAVFYVNKSAAKSAPPSLVLIEMKWWT